MQALRLYSVAFFSTLSLNVLSPLLPDVSKEFGLPGIAGIARVGGWNNLLIFFPMGFVSLLYSLRGRFRILPVWVLLLQALAGLALAVSPSLIIFAAAHVILGATLGLLIPALYASGRAIADPEKGFQMSASINIAIGVAMAAGQFAAALAGTHVSWRWVYAGLAAGSTAALALSAGLPPGPEPVSAPFRTIKRSSRLLLVQYLPGSIPWGALTVFIFPYLEIECGKSRAVAALLVTILGVGMVAGAFISGVIGDRLAASGKSSVILALIAFFCIGGAAAWALIELSTLESIALLALVYVATGVILAVPGAWIKGMLFHDADPARVQAAFSMETFLESLGKGLGPFVVSVLIASTSSLQSGMLGSLFFWLLCIPPLILLLRGSNGDTEQTR